MKTNATEVYLFYDPSTDQGKKARAMAGTIAEHVNDFDITKTPLTTTIWRQLLNQLELEPKRLLNKAHPLYQEKIRGHEFDDEGWLQILQHNPELLIGPILLHGNKAVIVNSLADVHKVLQKVNS